jgi:hypothetical protein
VRPADHRDHPEPTRRVASHAEEPMLRAAVAMLVLTGAAAHAAECTPAVESRWKAATREDARAAQVVEREVKKGTKANKAEICKAARSAPNLLKAAREYYEACDPEDAQAAIAPIQAHADEAAAFYQTYCLNAKDAPASR